MKKKGGGEDGGGNWMDTYGDLVTLLLTFFVLLYSMSSVDSKKWDIFVRSIYPDGKTPSEKAASQTPLIVDSEAEKADETTETQADPAGDPVAPENEIPDSEDLYIQIAAALQQAGVSDVTVTGGEDYTFVVFKDKAFFGGDSSVLTDQGKYILDIFCDTIKDSNDAISQMNIMGHTAKANPNQDNSVRGDRMLSGMRASEVCIYIQEKGIVDPDKLVSIGFGQYRPLESNDTAEGRASNRRVEILIIDKDAKERSIEDYYKEIQDNINGDTTVILREDGSYANQAAQGADTGVVDGAAPAVEPVPGN
ncbi:OmpA/MotB family protein [[Clostridium] aminophilum]|uniref:Chemotaxis protein MotB n=1 Tax=[Clostridium] aminophilum TaxID=1526 RepID=A0A1I6IUL4_9FIRM|nr:flagellar motor protein MotB [[Clostridium] aminophilum]MCR4629028.1 OmpA family protein [Clostridium sp.]SFR70424.1 chemotaxis protein MotB [[Clostridium] aminophilum]